MKPAFFFKAAKKLFPVLFLFSMGSAFCQAEFRQGVYSQETLSTIRALVETGSAKEIARALKSFPDLANERYNQSGDSLLMVAVQNKRDADVIKSLLAGGVDPDAINLNGDSAVIYGARYGASTKILKAIIEYKAPAWRRRNRANMKNNMNARAYDIAPEGSAQRRLLAAYLPKNYEPEILKSEDIFVFAEPEADEPSPEIKMGELPLARRPLAQIDPDKRRYLFEGISPFEIYEKEENEAPAVVRNPDRRYAQGRTAMHTAAATDDIRTMEILLRSGANINLVDDLGWNAIMYAARFAKKRETVSFLLQRGADFKARANFGTSVLDTAAAQNTSGDVMDEFLKAASREEKESAFVVAAGLGRPAEIVTAFFRNGVQPNFFHKGKTPLMYAAELNSDTNCIRVLLENGADKSLLSRDYKDAFYFASKNPYLPRDNVYWSLNNSTGRN